MIEVQKSRTFDQWLNKLRDDRAVARINIRIERLALGNPGNVEPVGEGVSELKIDYAPDTASTSCTTDRPWSCSCAEATRRPSRKTSNRPNESRRSGRHDDRDLHPL